MPKGRANSSFFERGATYRAKSTFEAVRDHFDPAERLVHFQYAVSIYDGMQGWFFYVEGAKDRVRSWDIPTGPVPAEVPFEKLRDVHPCVIAAAADDADQLGELVRPCEEDDPFVRVALNLAVESGAAAAAAGIVRHAKLSPAVTIAALSEAARERRPEVARALLDAGVPAAPSAIWPAVWSGAASILEELLRRGAEIEKSERSLASMIEFSERQNHHGVLEILRKLA